MDHFGDELAGEHVAQHAVIWCYESPTWSPYCKRSPFTAHARINDNYVNGIWSKVWVHCGQDESRSRYVLRSDVMTDINNDGPRIDTQDHPMHNTGVAIHCPKVAKQRDYTHCTSSLQYST